MSQYLKTINSPYYSFTPRANNIDEGDEQSAFITEDIKGIQCVIGGNRSGKSACGCYKVAKFLRETPPPRKDCPYWIVSQTLEMVGSNNWNTHLTKFITPDLIKDISWYNQARGLPKSVILKPHVNGNNWVIDFRSYDMDRRALQAVSLGGFLLDELCPYSILTEIWARCSDYDFPASKFYVLTPLIDGSKGYDTYELEQIWKDRANRQDWKFYRFNSALNTNLAEGFIDRFIANEVEELRLTRLRGDFCSLSGAIYKSFSDANIVEPFPIPEKCWHIRAIDFGWSHETAVVWVAKIDGIYYVYKEYHQQKTLMRDHALAIQAEPFGTDSRYYGPFWADHAAAQERQELAALGIQTQMAVKDVIKGIGIVQRHFRDKKLFIFSTCKNLIRQIRGYCWSGTVKDKVAKQDDDSCFVAGTLITTSEGQVPIENIRPGMMALTRKGYRRINAAGSTGIKKVMQLTCEDGRTLTGTPNHPIWINNCWLPMQNVPGTITPASDARVYNLSVDEVPEYFANGILVHNCDSLRYAICSDQETDQVVYKQIKIPERGHKYVN